jgi:hypothetical protein
MSWYDQRITAAVAEKIERLISWMPWHREYFAGLEDEWSRAEVAHRKRMDARRQKGE